MNTRRRFIRNSAALTALATMGFDSTIAKSAPSAANVDLCLAYFWGLPARKMLLQQQMGITGVVAPSSPWAVGLRDTQPWEYEAVAAVKAAWEKNGLQWKVLEGTPPLDKVKLGLDGRDQEIDNFITLMRNL